MSKQWSELDVIKRISKTAGQHYPGLVQGIGDDCAVIGANPGEQLVITSDMLVEGVHFDLSYVPLKHLGYKSVVVNISDIIFESDGANISNWPDVNGLVPDPFTATE